MADIYQEIWQADQSAAGVPALLDQPGVGTDESSGFVKVSAELSADSPELRVLTSAHIPAAKLQTYELCRVLFDNYALRERDEEIETAREREEVHDLVHAMLDTPPMEVAREYVSARTGATLTRERWYNTIMDHWFRRFSAGGDPDLTGFEHVVVGEQQGARVQGYHFWYKYYLDDGFAREGDGGRSFPGLAEDRIVYLGARQPDEQAQFPECVTISYKWLAPDYEERVVRQLTKPVGGFFVGCSVEGLLAMGSVRAHLGADAPKGAIINGAKYKLKVFRSANNRHVRTFYPMFDGAASSEDARGHGGETSRPRGSVRIVAALVNPEGHDPGSETITLLNTSAAAIDLAGWRLLDRNGSGQDLAALTLQNGEATRLALDPDSIQLSNRGGTIRLQRADGSTEDSVQYTRGQVRAQGVTTIF